MNDRRELVEEILAGLEARGAGDGLQLLDLMRAEQQLVDVLAVLRRQISALVRQSERRPLPESD